MRSSPNVVLTWSARRYCNRLLLLPAAVILIGLPASSAAGRDATGCVPGEIIVKLERSSQHPSYALHMLELEGAKCGLKLRTLEPLFPRLKMLGMGLERIYLVKYDAAMPPEDVAARYAALEGVSYASPNWLLEYAGAPDDPGFSRQYYLHNTGQCLNPPLCSIQGTMDADVDAPEAWDLVGEAANAVVIGIVDTGTLPTHEDLVGQLWLNSGEVEGNGLDDDENGFIDDVNGWNFETSSGNVADASLLSHGTRIAGILGARTNNGVGIAGICPQPRLMTVVIGSGLTFPTSAAVQGLLYAVDNGAQVVNISWGGVVPYDVLADAIAYATANSAVLVAAAGNSNSDEAMWPAAFPDVIGVAATDWNDRKAEFSSYGAWVDIAAAGHQLYSTRSNGGYSYSQGTSFAAPVVAGCAALLLSYDPTLQPQRIRELLLSTADPIDALNAGYEGLLGAGRVNAASALRSLESVTATEDQRNDLGAGRATLRAMGANPARPPIQFAFSVPHRAGYVIGVFDIRGRLVRQIAVASFTNATIGNVLWDGRDAQGRAVATGVYFCRLQCYGETKTVPVLLER